MIQLSVADLVKEVHDVHHPVSSMRYYDEQKSEALRAAETFRDQRLPKWLNWIDRVLQGSGLFVNGAQPGYPDTSLFQVLAGLQYAFPHAMKRLLSEHPLLVSHHQRVADLPAIASWIS